LDAIVFCFDALPTLFISSVCRLRSLPATQIDAHRNGCVGGSPEAFWFEFLRKSHRMLLAFVHL
jgi:hypothetical protein